LVSEEWCLKFKNSSHRILISISSVVFFFFFFAILSAACFL
jgi:hypothetical protein